MGEYIEEDLKRLDCFPDKMSDALKTLLLADKTATNGNGFFILVVTKDAVMGKLDARFTLTQNVAFAAKLKSLSDKSLEAVKDRFKDIADNMEGD